MAQALGNRAIALEGERISTWGTNDQEFANVGFRIPFQPGLLRSIRSAKADVIVAEGFFQWTPAAVLAKIKEGIRLVIAYERTMHTERHAGKARTLYRKLVTRYTDAICCNGSLSKEYCTNVLGFPMERIVTGAMAADTDAISRALDKIEAKDLTAMEKRLNLIRPIFLYVGRLIRLKGLRELLSAWKQYQDMSGVGSLLLVGDGSEREVLERIIRDQRIGNVTFTGRIQQKDIVPYYALSDVLVMPTLEDNWSLVVPEAMACSKPILCSKHNGCWPELVRDGLNGYLFDPHDAGGLALLLKKCSDGWTQLAEMGRASHEIVQDYSPRKAAGAVLRACRIAAKSRHSH
jgi:glycosyltransferase involved in cell wall biosynthesis